MTLGPILIVKKAPLLGLRSGIGGTRLFDGARLAYALKMTSKRKC